MNNWNFTLWDFTFVDILILAIAISSLVLTCYRSKKKVKLKYTFDPELENIPEQTKENKFEGTIMITNVGNIIGSVNPPRICLSSDFKTEFVKVITIDGLPQGVPVTDNYPIEIHPSECKTFQYTINPKSIPTPGTEIRYQGHIIISEVGSETEKFKVCITWRC
ncbi:hypothetical protein KAW65_06880 [candidate division WOR-3 bacterium]|nr:hypothetical protein [candidate division WOR-3 bacterium]